MAMANGAVVARAVITPSLAMTRILACAPPGNRLVLRVISRLG